MVGRAAPSASAGIAVSGGVAAHLRQRVPAVARLPADLQGRLKRHIQVFIAEKAFIGCRGQAITDEVRVTFAAQACLLLLVHAQVDCYPRLRQILVYPHAFVVRHDQDSGVADGCPWRRSAAVDPP